MPTFTVSTTGGNWSSTATWVGGVLPAVGDDIVANATSGPLTVDSNRTCLTINFTGYTNTFTINNGVTLTVTGTAITLGSGMTYDQTTTGILSTRGNQAAITITFNGITIHNLTLGKTTAGTLQTVTISGTTPTIRNLVISNGASNAGTTLSGTAITITSSLNCVLGPLTNNTGQITFSGTCTIQSQASSATISGGFNVTTGSSLQMLNNVYLSTGTVTFTGTATLNPGTFTLFCPGIVTFNTSTVTWYNISLQSIGQTYPLLSALNISNNLSIINQAFSGGFPINVSGSFLGTGTGLNLLTSTLNMLGSGSIEMFGSITNGTININGTGTYTLGSSTYPNTTLFNITLNLVGTSTAQVYSTTGHTLSTGGSLVLSTNNTSTGANIIGGSQIIWGNINLTSNLTTTLTYDTTALGNLNANSNALNGAKLFVAGNLSVTTTIIGTSTIELNGSNNTTWGAGIYQNSIIVNKSLGATVTTGSTITWGAANRSLIFNSAVNFLTNSNTLTLSGTPLTITNSFGSPFFNLSVPNNGTLILNAPITINNNLTLNGSATFQGTAGWVCANLISTAAGTFTVTLQQAVTYRTRLQAFITGGTSGARTTIISSGASTRAIWTLDQGASQSLIYVNGTRIDSSQGQTVWTFGGTISTTPVGAETLNWNVGSPPGTFAYTFLN
jgi:hypothetical protein